MSSRVTDASRHNADDVIGSRWKYAAVVSAQGWGIGEIKVGWGGTKVCHTAWSIWLVGGVLVWKRWHEVQQHSLLCPTSLLPPAGKTYANTGRTNLPGFLTCVPFILSHRATSEMHSRKNKQEEQQALSSLPTSTLPVGFGPEEFCCMDGAQRNKSMNLRDINQQTRRERKRASCVFFFFLWSHILSFYFSFPYFCSSHSFRSSTSCRFDYLNQPSLTQGFRAKTNKISQKNMDDCPQEGTLQFPNITLNIYQITVHMCP